VDGVELFVRVQPVARFELVRVELVDEIAAQGNHVATCRVLDKAGLQIGDQVSLAWPWPDLTEFALPGNPNGQHPITNKYYPPAAGPLALVLRDAEGRLVADEVGGLGLPGGHHVSFVATWRERGGVVDPEPEPEPGADDNLVVMAGRVVVALERVAVVLERLAAHLGA
jgi:hypothetical protein